VFGLCPGPETLHRGSEAGLGRRRFISTMVGAGLALLLGIAMPGTPPAQAPAKRKTLERIRIRRYVDLDNGSVQEGELIDLKEIRPVKVDAELSSAQETLYRGRIADADLSIVKSRLSVTDLKGGYTKW
jgi:hypothetical protein